MTNGRDIVVHLPPQAGSGPYAYHHIATEVWIYTMGPGPFSRLSFERVCDSSGEDPKCSRSVLGSSISDHLQYLGIPLNFPIIVDSSDHGPDRKSDAKQLRLPELPQPSVS
eukprot:TRINITY_DN4304_c0_g3_i2.p2 TRINITY_DN4304_c0_g3~~TRINITY_DN4304_c0_g3_i2.p2  ORF type:complete len:111 (-),score=9.77 TRINITY_DN4304_c0_g3_i2:883-1215(-)